MVAGNSRVVVVGTIIIVAVVAAVFLSMSNSDTPFVNEPTSEITATALMYYILN